VVEDAIESIDDRARYSASSARNVPVCADAMVVDSRIAHAVMLTLRIMTRVLTNFLHSAVAAKIGK
jgi:hypothetical protein